MMDLSKDQLKALYDVASDMHLGFNAWAAPVYIDGHGDERLFDPLTHDASALRLQIHYRLMLEVTEYGVFVRSAEGRMLLWKEFPKNFTRNQELEVCRKALFHAAYRVISEARQQAELTATS